MVKRTADGRAIARREELLACWENLFSAEFSGHTRTFKYEQALAEVAAIIKDFTLRITRGDRIGVVGANGSGKTTLLKLLLGTEKPQRGTVSRAAGVSVSYVPQLETVNWNFPVTVQDCVLMSRPARRPSPPPACSSRCRGPPRQTGAPRCRT